MLKSLVDGDHQATPRPVARWVQEPDGRGGSRLVMRWSVPDLDAELARWAAVDR